MAIMQQCPRCHVRFSLKHKKCVSCGSTIPSLRRVLFLEVRDESGKRIIRSLGNVSIEFAKNEEFKIKRDIKEGKLETKKQIWSDVVSAFVKKLEASEKSDRYIQDTYRYLSQMSDFWGKDVPIQQIKPQKVIEFRLSLTKKQLSPASMDRYFAAGRAAWNYSVKDYSNPFADIGLLRVDNTLTRYLTDQQRSDLLHACMKVSRQLYEIVIVALSTGLRKGNILRLKRTDVDYDAGWISVIGKGKKRHYVYPAPDVLAMLSSVPDNESEYFWVNPETKLPYHIDWRKPWIRAKRIAGLSNFRFHDLRHAAGTEAYRQTGDLRLVSQMLGHAEMRTTTRYAHVLEDTLRDGFSKINPLSTYASHMPETNNNIKP